MSLMAPLAALLIASLSIMLLRGHAMQWGLADLPGGRKQHQGAIPLIGGIGVFAGFLLAQPFLPATATGLLPLHAGLLLLVGCGVIDDARDMRSTVKLGVQLLAATLMVLWGGRELDYLGDFPLIGAVHLGWLAIPLTIVAVAGLVNAVNMMDGVDGLAGGSALSVLAWLALLAAMQGQQTLLLVIVTLAAALTGFLPFNMRHPWRNRASVFMGDAGSMGLGFAVAWFVVELSQSPNAIISPVAYGWLLALPVMDTLSLMFRRLRKGRSPFSADREHLHHLLLRAGFTPGQTTVILMLLVALLGGIGVLLSLLGAPDIVLLAGLLLLVLLHDLFVRMGWRTSKALRRLHRRLLGGPAVRDPEQLIRLRQCERVGSGRHQLALLGLYLMAFSLGLNWWLPALGAALVVGSALLACPLFCRDLLRLPLFWCSLALSLYVMVRGLASGQLNFSPDALLWWRLLALAGLLTLPMAWWLAQSRPHWPWLVLTLVAGAVLSILLYTDWWELRMGILANPDTWGPPAQIGFMASLGLLTCMTLLFAGLKRLGTGWRPAAQLLLALCLTLPATLVLMHTSYMTAWLATAAGAFTYWILGLAMDRYDVNRMATYCLLSLAGLAVLALLSHDLLLESNRSLAQRLLQPLQALGLALNGDLEQARLVHAGVVERALLWHNALQQFSDHWLIGTGLLELERPLVDAAGLAGYRDHASLLANLLAGLGLLGFVGMAAVLLLTLQPVLWALRHRQWRGLWGLGILSSAVAVLTFNLFANPLLYQTNVWLIVLLMAAAQSASLQRDWGRQQAGLANSSTGAV